MELDVEFTNIRKYSETLIFVVSDVMIILIVIHNVIYICNVYIFKLLLKLVLHLC